eukprot:g32970.t1
MRLKYAEAADQVLAVAFDYVPHPKILSQPDAIPDELIAQAIEQFLSRNDVKGDRIAISVPGQTALTRFIQLPPVESSKVAEIVKYEARQQIPFALEDVCWQWQTLGGGTEESGYMLEAEVGLFAMKRDQVMQHLQPFVDRQVEVDLIQIAPLALYNFLAYDRLGIRSADAPTGGDEHTIILDMGADNTTLMVSNGEKIWIRNVPIGGNHFTRALTKEMKLTFAKAEHLKLNATKSPDPRAVFQALRPVFNDYVSEIQRSIGYFSSVNRNAKIAKVIGIGNGFKLAGLQKFLQQNLQYDVERVDTFQGLVGDTVLNAKLFDENILSFAVPYGLALQALDLTRIHVDLLPEEIRTARMIRRKKPWACAAAATLLASLALSATGYARYEKSVGNERFGASIDVATQVASKAATDKTAYQAEVTKFKAQDAIDGKLVRSREGKLRFAELHKAVVACLPRDKVGEYKENEITKRNRIKVYSFSVKKEADLSKWFKSLTPSMKAFMRKEDRTNEPTGSGYVVTMQVAHYHRTIRGKEKNWIRENFISNLEEYEVEQPNPGPDPEVSLVRGLGISHALITETAPVEEIKYYLDRRSLNKGRLRGTGRMRFGADGMPDAGMPEAGLPGAGMPEVGMPGSGMPDAGMPGVGMPPGVLGQGQGAIPGLKTKRKNIDDKDNTLMIPLTQATVQFVWRPMPRDKRELFTILNSFFKNNPQFKTKPEGAFEAVSAHVEKLRKESKGRSSTKKLDLTKELCTMENLQPLITHRFWVLFGVAMLLIPIGWWMGVGDLKSRIEAGESAIDSALTNIPTGDNHPNPDWIKGAQAVNGKREIYYDNHAEALYKRQQQLQTWPASIASTFENIPYLGQVPPKKCSEYADAYFIDSIPRMYKIVDPVIVDPDDETKQKFTGKVVFPYDLVPKVPFTKWQRFAPSSDELWKAQEDVWLLTALLKAIARVNQGDERIDTAAIRQILQISLHGGTAESAEGQSDEGSGAGSMGMGMGGTESIGNAGGGGNALGMGIGMGGGNEQGKSKGFTAIIPEPEEIFGKPRPLPSAGGSEEGATGNAGMDMPGGPAATMGLGAGGGESSANDKMSPYVDENPEDPFKTRGFILVVLMKRREIIRLQEQLGLMSFPVEIKLVQHVDRDPDLRGISIFRETGSGAGMPAGGAGGVGGVGGEDMMMGEGGPAISPPGGGGLGAGGLGRNAAIKGPGGLPGGAPGNGNNAAAGTGKYPTAVQAALEDHGLCYVTIAGLMTIYQPPKPKAKPAATATPDQSQTPAPNAGDPKAGDPKAGDPKAAQPQIKAPKTGDPKAAGTKQPAAKNDPDTTKANPANKTNPQKKNTGSKLRLPGNSGDKQKNEMKLSASNLKGMDFKQILVQHGEKAVLGLAVFLALMAVICAKWSTYTKTTPSKLKEKAEVAAATIKSTKWPETEQASFPENDTLAGRIKLMQNPIAAAYLKPRIDFSFELYLKDKKLEDPKLLAIRQPIASYLQMVAAVPPPAEELNGEEPMGQEKSLPGKSKPKGSILRVKRGGVRAGGMPGMPGGVGGIAAGPGEANMPMADMPMGDMPMGGLPGGMPLGAGNEEGMEGGTVAGGYGKGFRTIAVRGVYPLNQQLKEFARALNLPSDDPHLVRQFLEFVDTIVERQISEDGGKTWGKWETLDSKEYVDFLKTELADYDAEVVDQMVIDPYITSPLPARLLWSWGTGEDSPATHPALSRFALTPEGRKAQQLIREQLAAEKKLVEESDRRNRTRGGFAPASRNFQEIAGGVMQSPGARNRVQQNIKSGLNTDEGDPNRAKNELAKVTAAGHLLLFRFFDFKTRPGWTYRYRVHLKIKNPNYGRQVTEMAAGYENSVNEEFKVTPTSEPTAPVFVPSDVKYFLTRAEIKRSRRFDLVSPSVDMLVYQWFSDVGTTAKGVLKELTIGQAVQGKDNVVVVDPAKPSYEPSVPKEFSADVTLVDVDLGARQLDQNLMDELGLTSADKGRLSIQDEILVVNHHLGTLQILDPLTARNAERSADDSWKEVVTAFEQFQPKKKDSDMEGTLEGLTGMEGMDDMMGMGTGRTKKRKKSSLRPFDPRVFNRRVEPAAADQGGTTVAHNEAASSRGGLTGEFLMTAISKPCSWLVLAGLLLCIPAESNGAEQAATPEVVKDPSAQAAVWIEKLNSPKFKIREEASLQLRKLGKVAIEPVARAAETNDLETVARCVSILKCFYDSNDPAVKAAAEQQLKKLEKSPNATVARRAADATRKPEPAQRISPFGNRIMIVNGPNGRIQLQAMIARRVVNRAQRRAVARPGLVREITVNENGKKIHIHETLAPSRKILIKVTEKVAGKEKTTDYKANSSSKLRRMHPKVYELYRKHIGKARLKAQAAAMVPPRGAAVPRAAVLPAAPQQAQRVQFAANGVRISTRVVNGNREITVREGTKTTRITDENGKNIVIKVTEPVGGKVKTTEYKGKDLAELKKKHADGAKIYELFAGNNRLNVFRNRFGRVPNFPNPPQLPVAPFGRPGVAKNQTAKKEIEKANERLAVAMKQLKKLTSDKNPKPEELKKIAEEIQYARDALERAHTAIK